MSVFLYVVLLFHGDLVTQRVPMPNMETCLKVAEGAVSHGPTEAAENESLVVMYCGPGGMVWTRHDEWVNVKEPDPE